MNGFVRRRPRVHTTVLVINNAMGTPEHARMSLFHLNSAQPPTMIIS